MQNDREEEDDDEEGSLKDFIDDGEESGEATGSDSDIQEVDESGEDVKRSTRQNKVPESFSRSRSNWQCFAGPFFILKLEPK